MNIALDIGNVLVRVDLNSFAEKLVKKELLPSVKESMPILEGIQISLDLGFTDIKEALSRRFNISDKEMLDELHADWLQTIHPVTEVVELINNMSNNNHQIALLSNIGFDHVGVIDGLFSKCIKHFSCNLGIRKPSILFFQSFILAHPEFKGAVFLDDREENVEAANASSFKASVFNISKISNDSAKLALREYFPEIVIDNIE